MNAKTVIVDIRVGDGIDRQTYAADKFDRDEHKGLTVTRDGRPVAGYAPGEWVSARTGDAIAPDAAPRPGLARAGLNEILDTIAEVPPELYLGEGAARTGRALAAIRALARDALSAPEAGQ